MIERIESNFIGSNVFVISKEDACFVVDAGVDLETLKATVGNKKVEGIFLTHGHYDHCFFVEQYLKEFGCKVFCSENIKEYLQNPDYNYSEGHFKLDNFENFVFLHEKGIVNLDNFEVEFHQLGGHSKSDMCYKFEDDVFVGDVLIGRDMGRIDLYGSDKLEMSKSLKFLQNYDFSTMHSGHGEDNSKLTQNKVINLWLRFLNR